MNCSRKVTYRAGLFDPKNLITQAQIDEALNEIGAVMNSDNYAGVLQDLLDKSHITELVLSGISEEIPLDFWILDDFPSEPKFFENSFAHQLLVVLSNFFLFYSSSADDDTASLLRSHHHTVQLAPLVIQTLLTATFLEEDSPKGSIGGPALWVPKSVKVKGSQKEQKRARRAAHEAATFDTRPFSALQLLPVPKRRSEADDMCQRLLARMRNILRVLLTGIRREEVVEVISSMFIPKERPEDLTIVTEAPVEQSSIPPAPTVEDVPSIFPMVQPMKTAFYFDSPDDFGKWRILLASQAQSHLRDFQRRDKKIFNIILRKIKDLSNGFFSADNQKRLIGPSTDVPVFEAKMTRDLRLVYIVDCIVDYDNSSEVQALRIFGIFTHSQMDGRLWASVSRFLSSRGKEYRERCIARTSHPDGGNIYLPKSFPDSVEIDELGDPVDYIPTLPIDDENQLHRIISLEKYVVLSKGLLESIEANIDANFPFEVSKNERAIIQHPHSCYVLGRSGTGKTTTMLFKMLLIEREYQLSDRSRQPPRQIFVTKSRVLVRKVEEHFITYLSSLSFASHTEEHFSFGKVNESVADEENLFDEEDETKWRNDLPEKFTDLEENHFPLFITFDHLCTMLEADTQFAPNESSGRQRRSMTAQDKAPSRTKNCRLVDFDRFLAAYWPHFPQSLIKNFHPLLIFNEFIGIIAGSEGAILSPDGYLDRQAYLKLSPRSYATFANHRDTVYDLFLVYLKRKGQLDDIDVANRTHSIIRSIANTPSVLQKISHLYVDETQDNLLIDTFLLRLLCRNTDGLFWAGDTAQTISAGSSFRFNDLKAFLHRMQVKLFEKKISKIRVKEPRMFCLAVNYRSHAGIVNCAHTIIEIIKKFWMESIDSLPREKGNAYGAKPIFYTDVYPEFVRQGHFLSRNTEMQAKDIELGANQCILVRDDRAKKRLKQEVSPEMRKKLGLILTLYESKGLEFNDVLLYNFFHDSQVDAGRWRLVLHGVSRENGDSVAAPRYDPMRHAALCTELKCLYVAVTRARNNLRIVDESPKGEYVQTMWERKDQVMKCRPGQESTDFAKPSSDEEWAKRGKLFFDNKQWLLALQCYEKAGKKRPAAVADAYHKREQAKRMPMKSKDKARDDAFGSAADSFLGCARNTNDTVHKSKYLKLSAECYADGGKITCAAKVYREGGWLAEASTLLRKLGRFDDIYDIITAQPDSSAASAVPGPIHDVTRLYYVSKKDYDKAHQLFESEQEELEYLEDRNLDHAQLHFLLLHGRKGKAAELQLLEGRIIEAIDLFLEDDEDISMSRAKETILQNLWHLTPFGVTLIKRDKVRELLDRSERVTIVDENDREELLMFRSIVDDYHERLAELATSFTKRGNLDAALLCFDHYYNQVPRLVERDIEKIARDLAQFANYVGILHDLTFLEDPIDNRRCRKIFGIQPGEKDGTTVLLPYSLLYNYARISGTALENDNVLPNESFLEVYQKCLRGRLLDRVTRENDACRKAPALHTPPCIEHVVHGTCEHSPCERLHISPDMIWFKNWISSILLQILIYHSVSRIQYPSQLRSEMRFWLMKLYEALSPSCHTFGSTSNMTLNSAVTALPKAIAAVMDWVRTLTSELEFHPGHQFLTLAMQTADFAFTFDRKQAEVYIYRSQFAVSPCPSLYLRRPSGNNVIQEMLISLNQNDSSSLIKGILFIRHVVERKIPINIHVFCSFIEHICSLLIVCNHLRWAGNLHSVMLPRSWLRAILDRLDTSEAMLQDSSRFWLLLQPLDAVIQDLYFIPTSELQDRCHFKVGPEFRNLGGFAMRGLFIARLCRVLGLLGSNIGVERFQTDILNIFVSIRNRSDLKFTRSYAGYFYAETFNDVHRITRRSMKNAVFDEMIQLMHADLVKHPVRELFGLRRIIFSTQDELETLVDPVASSQYSGPSVKFEGDQDTLDQASLDQEEDGELEIDAAIPEFEPEHQLVPDTEIPEELYAAYSEQHNQAASIIQGVCKRFLQRKRNMLDGVGQAATTRRCFVLYKGALHPEMRMSVPGMVQYSIVYLGPLPHLFAALEAIQSPLLKAKYELKKRLVSDIQHEELDEVDANITRLNEAMKNFKRIYQQVKPGSVIHHKRDSDGLTKAVRDVFNILRGVQDIIHIPEDLQGSIDIVYKAFLQEKRAPKEEHPRRKERRPNLKMEDLHDLIQEVHGG